MSQQTFSVEERLRAVGKKYYPADLGAAGHVVTDAYVAQIGEKPPKEERSVRGEMMRVNVYPLSFVPSMDELLIKYLKSKERRWVLSGPLRRERNQRRNQREQEKGQKRRIEKEAREKAIAEAKAAKAAAKAQRAAEASQKPPQPAPAPVPVPAPVPAATNEPQPEKRKRQRIKVAIKPVVRVK
jgi:pyruvate/2-oxoglutarate dehydrogenase complex dihydrolipoamide acyltransferase (E2) component